MLKTVLLCQRRNRRSGARFQKAAGSAQGIKARTVNWCEQANAFIDRIAEEWSDTRARRWHLSGLRNTTVIPRTSWGRRLAWARDACHHGGMRTVFEAAGGIEGLRRLAGAWHRRVMADEVVGHAFSHGFHPQHVERLAAYWAEALGGPSMYSESYGDETGVVRIHSGNGVHDEMDRRAIVCFDQALADVGLADDSALRQVLHDYFAWATTTTLARYHGSADDVPDGLTIPRWSWDGLQE